MAEDVIPHNIDVGIRTIVMQAAQTRVKQMRQQERVTDGVPKTTMASVGRGILTAWKPEKTRSVGLVQGLPTDAAGNRLTQRGHRKYARSDLDVFPTRSAEMPDLVRATQLLNHLRRVSDPARGTTLGPIAAVRKAARDEGLLDFAVDGKPLVKHISAAERSVLKPLRFTLPEDVYRKIAERLSQAGCTVTRALEVGLEEFARTGVIDSKE